MANIFESNAPQDGVRATESAHRKIELQSPADLTYLIANVTKAAREKLDQHLPPDAVPEGEDAMRKRVEQLVDDVQPPRLCIRVPTKLIEGTAVHSFHLQCSQRQHHNQRHGHARD